MIHFKVMDYNKRELLTIQVALGLPTMGTVKVLNQLEQELPIEKVILNFDEHTETYEARIVTREETRLATIVGVETV